MATRDHSLATTIHKGAYRTNVDPGAVGEGVLWVDTSGGAAPWPLKVRNAADDGWEEVGSVGGGGGGAALTYVGTDAVGASSEAWATDRAYCKQITLAADSLLTAIEVYVVRTGGYNIRLMASVYADVGGAPDHPIYNAPNPQAVSTQASEWVTVPLSVRLPAGTYWLVVAMLQYQGAQPSIAYDAGGSDQYFAANSNLGGEFDSGVDISGLTTTAHNNSIRATAIAGGATSPVGDSDWLAFPALVNSWGDLGAPYGALGYRKDADGFVHLRGVLDGSSATSNIISTAGLPVGYRPANDVAMPTKGRGDGGGAFVLIIKADGTIRIADNIATQGNSTSASPGVALDGLSYFVGPIGNAPAADPSWTDATLAGTWTSNTTSAAYSNVGYRKDGSGVVHLRGMATGGGAALIFTLPVGYRPDHDVWLTAQTFGGVLGVFVKASDGTVSVAAYADGTGGSGQTNLRLDGLCFWAA
jgi:hypothetical protein